MKPRHIETRDGFAMIGIDLDVFEVIARTRRTPDESYSEILLRLIAAAPKPEDGGR